MYGNGKSNDKSKGKSVGGSFSFFLSDSCRLPADS